MLSCKAVDLTAEVADEATKFLVSFVTWSRTVPIDATCTSKLVSTNEKGALFLNCTHFGAIESSQRIFSKPFANLTHKRLNRLRKQSIIVPKNATQR